MFVFSDVKYMSDFFSFFYLYFFLIAQLNLTTCSCEFFFNLCRISVEGALYNTFSFFKSNLYNQQYQEPDIYQK